MLDVKVVKAGLEMVIICYEEIIKKEEKRITGYL